MAKDKCCIAPADLRVIYFEATNTPVRQVVYTVPAGKVFVVNMWSIGPFGDQVFGVIGRLWRNNALVARNRNGGSHPHNEIAFPTGIGFAAGDTLELETTFNAGVHFFYGYEVDD